MKLNFYCSAGEMSRRYLILSGLLFGTLCFQFLQTDFSSAFWLFGAGLGLSLAAASLLSLLHLEVKTFQYLCFENHMYLA